MKKRCLTLLILAFPVALAGCDFDDSCNWRCTPEEFFGNSEVSSPEKARFSTTTSLGSSPKSAYVTCPLPHGGYGVYTESLDFQDPKQSLYTALKKITYTSISSWSEWTDGLLPVLDFGVCREDYYYIYRLRSDGQLLITYSNGDIWAETGRQFFKISLEDTKSLSSLAKALSQPQSYQDASAFEAAKGTFLRAQMFGDYLTGHGNRGTEENELVNDLGPYDAKVNSTTYSGYYLNYDCGPFDRNQIQSELWLSFYLGDSNLKTVRDHRFFAGEPLDWYVAEA
jgi:hypothetical protein